MGAYKSDRTYLIRMGLSMADKAQCAMKCTLMLSRRANEPLCHNTRITNEGRIQQKAAGG